MSDTENLGILCRICGQPLSLTSDIVVDEDGKAVHEECYVKHIKQTMATDAGQQEAS
jgi:hypothetical protein